MNRLDLGAELRDPPFVHDVGRDDVQRDGRVGRDDYRLVGVGRAQAVGFKGRELLRRIPGVKPSTVMECCGHDGTYAMTVEGFEPSFRIGKKAFDGLKDGGGEVWATDCPLAAIQFEQHAGRKPLHPMTILARAYREDGFPTRLVPPPAPMASGGGA